MLDGFRKHSNSIIVKALLFLLIASFAAWGVGDMLRPATTSSSVGTVGGVEVSAQEVFNDFQREMNRMRQLTGGQVDGQLSMVIGNSVVDRAINRTLLEVNADEMDIAVSDELVAQSIKETEMFQDNGQFSRLRFEQVLFSNQLNEGQFIELVRGDLQREQLVSALVNGSVMPLSAVEDLYKHRQEKRSADFVQITTANVGDVAAASQDDLRKYYDDNLDKFMAPEYRSVSLLHIQPSDVAKTIEVPLEKIEDAFTARQAEFKKPGRRTVEQMVFATEEEAQAAVEAMAGGQSFADVAKEKLGLEADSLVLGDVTKEELPEELREDVFALAKDGVSAPIQSLLGWHIVRVTDVVAEQNPTFEEVKDQLREGVAMEMAADELFAISNDVEDALGGGATIEEAAKASGFELRRLSAVDRQGLDTEGNETDIASNAEILNEIFTVELNTEPTMKDDGLGGYFMVRVDGVTASQARDFEQVKFVAAEMLEQEKKQALAQEKADALLAAVKGGKTLQVAAEEAGFTVESGEGFTRFDAPLPQSVVAKLFTAKVDEAVNGQATDGYVVAVLKNIQAIEGADDENAINAMRRQLQESVTGDLQGQFVNALRDRYTVSVDRNLVNSLFVQEQQ